MTFRPPACIGVLLCSVVLFCPEATAAEAIKNSTCLECHSDDSLTKTNAARREISLFVDEAKLNASMHKTNSCQSCHPDITEQHPDDGVAAKSVRCSSCHEKQSESYGASVHGRALAQGNAGSATCSDCHGTHYVIRPTASASPLHFSRLAKTCGECHDQEASDVEESVHGKAIAEGHRDAPTCTDCHSEHRILTLKGSTSGDHSVDVCSTCHASERLNTKYNLPADRVRTFMDSYHGLASKYGSTLAANCGSCHGYHRVFPSSDPRSTVHPSNLVKTCGKCHPGASENFAVSKVHVDVSAADAGGDLGQTINWWVRRIYLALIFGTIGGMLLHNGLTFARKVAVKYRSTDHAIVRMDPSQRMQHMLLAVSFILLAITGFALKFPDSWIATMLGSNEEFRRWSHRIAGVVMLAVGAYHAYYVLAVREGRKLLKDMLPTGKDAADLGQNARYLTGSANKKPRFGRFGYAEKMEYWAVVWGTVIMGVTGLMIWFKMDVTRFMPRWAVDVATTIHYYEAILACLAIIVWHFYHVMFDPDVYPMNWAAWNGKVSKHWQKEEHPLDTTGLPPEARHPAPSQPRPSEPKRAPAGLRR